jgi:hypothetical protein
MEEQENYNLDKESLNRIIEISVRKKERELLTDFMIKVVSFGHTIMDDSFAIQHQTMGQYRSALMKNFRENIFNDYKEKLKILNEK